jgi:UPF0716 protein FxsA
MLTRLFLLFLLVPLLEVYLLVQVADVVGWPTMLAIVVLTALLGAHLARREGILHLHRIQRSFAEGQNPAPELLEGVMILLAAVLLLTPGLITDAVGFILLIPATRRPLRGVLLNWLKRHSVNWLFVQRPGALPGEPEVIDVTPDGFDEDR